MKTGEKQARLAVSNFLDSTTLPTMLWSVSCVADTAARTAGRKSELFPSLFDYERLIPAGFKCFWRKSKGLLYGDGLYSVDRVEKAIQDYPCPDA